MTPTAPTTPAAAPPASRSAPRGARPSAIEGQARQLDAIFKALARRVLVDDDPASELPLRQFRVCAALLDGPRPMKELSQELGVSQSAITQLADRLEAAGMVRRGPVEEDRRVRSLQLTERAQAMLRRREESRIARVTAILEKMSATERSAMLDSLTALRTATEDGSY